MCIGIDAQIFEVILVDLRERKFHMLLTKMSGVKEVDQEPRMCDLKKLTIKMKIT